MILESRTPVQKKTGEFVANCDEILIEFMDHP